MRLRYPEGMRSVVDATLALQGPADGAGAQRHGDREERELDARRSTTSGNLFSGLTGGEAALPRVEGQVAAASNVPLRYDVRIVAPSTLRIENDQARIVASADLTLRGTLRSAAAVRPRRDRARRSAVRRPPLPGHARQPRFRQRQPHSAVLRHRGRDARARAGPDLSRHACAWPAPPNGCSREFTSDPPLQTLDILTLLFSDQAPSGDIELASLRQPERARAAAAPGARDARADRRAVGRGRPRRRADLRRRHVPDHAAPDRSVSAVVAPQPQPGGARHDRQAHLRSHLPDLRAQPVVVDARRDHPARVRRERHRCRGCCRRTKIAPTRSKSGRGTRSDALLLPSVAFWLLCLLRPSARHGRAEAGGDNFSAAPSPMCASRSPA